VPNCSIPACSDEDVHSFDKVENLGAVIRVNGVSTTSLRKLFSVVSHG